MRILFTAWGWNTCYYPLVPLAWSARAAGHEVVVATQPGLAATVQRSGLPVAAVGTDVDAGAMMGGFLRRLTDRGSRNPPGWEEMRRFGVRNCWLNVAVCGAMAEGLWEFASRWRPDVIVHEATTYAGPLVAARLGVPAVRHTWGIDYAYLLREFEEEALAPFREAWDLGPVETLGALTVDPCPPSLQLPESPAVPAPVHRLPMRYVPYNGPGRPPRWLLEPARGPRVCVTWGMSSGRFDPGQVVIDQVIRAVAGLGVEVVAAVAPADRDLLGPLPSNVRVCEDIPLHTLLPTCDALISQGGLGTLMTALAAGVPQVVVPQTTDRLVNAERLTRSGAGLHLLPDDATPAGLRAALNRLLTEPAFRAAARRLKAEHDALATPGDVVGALERLVPGPTPPAPSRPI
ncbi:nucleotide disphospho-sugar-binding domain-containing protein [Streptomyces sp. NPDC089915]|uniref:nucleotide disphospho-sugar-binding domain-containing protein n=1 Tax=Streptomyces sp. NPDC089915 TaxID=3155186 RepID=UPI00342B05E3